MMSKKPYSLGLLVGRFQGVHLGHQMMIDTALSICGEVCVLIGSSQEEKTAKNPFSYELRRKMLQKIYGDRIKVFPLPDIGVGNCAAWGEYVTGKVVEYCGRRPDILVSGKEQRRASWLEGKEGASVAELYIPKTIDVSASKMREYFIADDRAAWESFCAPAIRDMYPALRNIVLESLENTETKSI